MAPAVFRHWVFGVCGYEGCVIDTSAFCSRSCFGKDCDQGVKDYGVKLVWFSADWGHVAALHFFTLHWLSQHAYPAPFFLLPCVMWKICWSEAGSLPTALLNIAPAPFWRCRHWHLCADKQPQLAQIWMTQAGKFNMILFRERKEVFILLLEGSCVYIYIIFIIVCKIVGASKDLMWEVSTALL